MLYDDTTILRVLRAARDDQDRQDVAAKNNVNLRPAYSWFSTARANDAWDVSTRKNEVSCEIHTDEGYASWRYKTTVNVWHARFVMDAFDIDAAVVLGLLRRNVAVETSDPTSPTYVVTYNKRRNIADTEFPSQKAARSNRELSLRENTDQGRQLGGGLLEQRHQGGGLFASDGRARRGDGAELFDAERICAKRWVNTSVYYLIQLVGYRELTWEPSQNIPWQLRVSFEREAVGVPVNERKARAALTAYASNSKDQHQRGQSEAAYAKQGHTAFLRSVHNSQEHGAHSDQRARQEAQVLSAIISAYTHKQEALSYRESCHNLDEAIEKFNGNLEGKELRARKKQINNHHKLRNLGDATVLPQAVDEDIVLWLSTLRKDGSPLSRVMLQLQAAEISAENGLEGKFAASPTWVKLSLPCHKLPLRVRTRQGQTTPRSAQVAANEFRPHVLQTIIEKKRMKVFNADQTGM
ncbi:hypothetical protein ON010_g14178 [Phytophthora cinnamomi]|nr:hypothetical protein ON010_g14178 [Phytophthora cinnamomi]